MKRAICILLILFFGCSVTACSNGEQDGTDTDQIAKILNPMEYALYLNIFQNGRGDELVGKSYTKEGVFAVLYDSYNSAVRYYVWGYSDETLCCDWQWEFVPQDTDNLPAVGSRIKMTGTLRESDRSLDGYWYEEAAVETVSEYIYGQGQYDTTTMSPTLTRVQIVNMVNHADEYDGKNIKIYGRVASDGSIQHPYYNGAWELPVEYDGTLPSIGTYVTVTGRFAGTSKSDSRIIAESVAAE